MQEQGVEESNSPGHLVGENHTALRGTKRFVKLQQTNQQQSESLRFTRLRVALSQGLRLRYLR